MASSRRAAPLAYLAPALTLYGLFVLWPLARVLALSTVRWDGIGPAAPVGLGNYRDLWADPGFADELAHSLIWLAVTLVAPVVMGLGLALLLDAAPAWLRGPARALLLAPLVLPAVVIAVAWRLLYNPLSGPLAGLPSLLGRPDLTIDPLGDPGLALGGLLVPACWASFGLSLLVFGAALRGVSPEVVAAARVDGAGALARLRHVALPALRGALPLATVVTALGAVPSLDLVLLTTNGGPGYATTTLTLDMYGRAFGGDPNVGAAAALAALQVVVGLALALLALGAARGQERALDGDGLYVGARARPAARGAPIGRISASGGVLVAAALALFPLLWLVVLAVRPAYGGGVGGGDASPWAALWGNLGAVWARDFGAAFAASALVAAAVALLTVALALPAAFALSMARRRAVQLLAGLLLALGLFQPEAILIVPLFRLLLDLRLLSSPLGLVLPETARALPFAVLLLWAALRALPADVTAAAAVDGAAPRQVLRRVAAPLVAPMVLVAALWAFVTSWNEYLLPVVVLQDDALQTVPEALGHFVGTVDTLYGLLAAGALLAVLPLLLLYGLLYGAVAAALRQRSAHPRG